jgi:hypothetical protein
MWEESVWSEFGVLALILLGMRGTKENIEKSPLELSVCRSSWVRNLSNTQAYSCCFRCVMLALGNVTNCMTACTSKQHLNGYFTWSGTVPDRYFGSLARNQTRETQPWGASSGFYRVTAALALWHNETSKCTVLGWSVHFHCSYNCRWNSYCLLSPILLSDLFVSIARFSFITSFHPPLFLENHPLIFIPFF